MEEEFFVEKGAFGTFQNIEKEKSTRRNTSSNNIGWQLYAVHNCKVQMEL